MLYMQESFFNTLFQVHLRHVIAFLHRGSLSCGLFFLDYKCPRESFWGWSHTKGLEKCHQEANLSSTTNTGIIYLFNLISMLGLTTLEPCKMRMLPYTQMLDGMHSTRRVYMHSKHAKPFVLWHVVVWIITIIIAIMNASSRINV